MRSSTRPGTRPFPRQAASVIVLRGGAERLELLLVQRTPHARFMGGFWVFPGGAVDAHEGEGDASHRLAAVRELEEEAGIGGLGPDELVKFSQWITPRQIAIRFDTHFFLAAVGDDTVVVIDGDEIVGVRTGSRRPRRSRRTERRPRPRLPDDQAPRAAAPFASAEALIDYASGREVLPVVPRVIREGEIARVVLPGEPGIRRRPGGRRVARPGARAGEPAHLRTGRPRRDRALFFAPGPTQPSPGPPGSGRRSLRGPGRFDRGASAQAHPPPALPARLGRRRLLRRRLLGLGLGRRRLLRRRRLGSSDLGSGAAGSSATSGSDSRRRLHGHRLHSRRFLRLGLGRRRLLRLRLRLHGAAGSSASGLGLGRRRLLHCRRLLRLGLDARGATGTSATGASASAAGASAAGAAGAPPPAIRAA